MRKKIKNGLMITLGWLFVVLAIIGVLLPILPTTPFLILALALFSKSSPIFHIILLDNKWFGPTLRQWEQHKTLSRKIKYKATALIIMAFVISILIIKDSIYLILMLLGIALVILLYIWSINEQ